MIKFQANNITKSYGEHIVLKDFSFDIENGVTAILGNNGAGKTTLINILTGLLKPDIGELRYEGQLVNANSKSYRALLGFLPQECGFYENFTALEFLKYIGTIKGVSYKECRDDIEKYLKTFSLWDKRNVSISKFSGGMKRRLGIVQAIMNSPQILIMDEPTTGLDYRERVAFKELILDYAKDHVVLLSTHIFSDVENIADHIIIINDGEKIYDEPFFAGDNIESIYLEQMKE